jgi:hypothetical protein
MLSSPAIVVILAASSRSGAPRAAPDEAANKNPTIVKETVARFSMASSQQVKSLSLKVSIAIDA